MSTKSADLSALRISRDKETQKEDGNGSPPAWKIIAAIAAAILIGIFYFSFRDSFASVVEVELTSASLTYPSQESAILTASGYVVAQQKASVASKGTGRLVFLGVEEGDRVLKGDIIARLEDADVMAELARVRADLEFALADSLEAGQSLGRQETLFKSSLISQAELDLVVARFNKVIASIKSARATVRMAEVSVENTRIRAPFDGTVLTKNADVGEVVAPFASSASSRGAVVTMADMSSLEVEADVSESNITRVKIGQPCEIGLDAYPEVRYQGYVHKIVPTADRAKATVLTKVRFKNRDQRVLPEMSAKVFFLAQELNPEQQHATRPLLTVPSTAIVQRDGNKVVFGIVEDMAQMISVKTGATSGARIEITEGLSQGDKVIVRPTDDIQDGTRVKLKSN